MANARTSKSAREKAAAMQAEAQRQAARKRTITAGVLVVVVLALVVGAFVGLQYLKSNDATVPKNLTDGGYLYPASPATAKVTVEIYQDFQCPICKQFEAGASATLHQYAKDGKIRLVYRPVAILDRASSTDYSTRALNAWASVLDVAPGAVDSYQDQLFANQPAEGSAGLSDDTLIELAVKAGASKDAVSPLINNQKFKDWTVTVTDQFSKKGYTGTPTVTINGVAQTNNDPTAIKAAIDKALAG